MKIEGYIVGDILLQRRLNLLNPNLKPIRDLFTKSDLVIGNLETTVHSNEGQPAAFPGGCYSMCPPESLGDLRDLNFRMFNIANNHMMDYGEMGLRSTIKYLKKFDYSFCGAGINLTEASKPCYYEAPEARVAMVGATSSFHDSYRAGRGNDEIQGRPGVNPLRHKAIYEIPKNDYLKLLELSEKMGINDYHNQAIFEGYLPQNKNFKFAGIEIIPGNDFTLQTYPNKVDENLILSNVCEASNNSDITIVCLHGHQFKNKNKRNEPEFLNTMARLCIEKGADIVVCTGPHVLRRVEKYNSKYILYGIGNFMFQHTMMDRLPEEFYNKYNKLRQNCTGVSEIMNIRSENGRKGLKKDSNAWESVIVKFFKNDKILNLSFIPIKIHKEGTKANIGLPYLCETHDSMSIITQSIIS